MDRDYISRTLLIIAVVFALAAWLTSSPTMPDTSTDGCAPIYRAYSYVLEDNEWVHIKDYEHNGYTVTITTLTDEEFTFPSHTLYLVRTGEEVCTIID